MPENSSIIFRGARIRYIDLRRKDEGSPFTRLHLAADFSAPVQEAMEWHIGDGMSSAKLKGVLTASHLILTPNDKRLKDHELQLECSEVEDFQLVELKDNEGERAGLELRFMARSVQPGACGLVEEYWTRIGHTDSQLKVAYIPQPVQQKLIEINGAAPSAPSNEGGKRAAADSGPEFKYAGDDKVQARIVVHEVEDGYSASSAADFKFRHPRALVDAPTLPCVSERESIGFAAKRIRDFARQLVDNGEETLGRQEKKSCKNLSEWCERLMTKDQITGQADGDGE